jgi:hypothetical protein
VPAIERTDPDPTLLRRGQRALDQLRMRREAEVVVGRQVDDLAAVEVSRGRLSIVEDAERSKKTLAPKRVELGGKKCQRIGSHEVRHRLSS